jgi:hypothetical protein
MARDSYMDGAAFGEAPMGPAPEGQPAGAKFPGNPMLDIDRSSPNPSERSLRMEALYNTIEERDLMKRDAGARMEKAMDARGRIQSDNRNMGPINKSGYDRNDLG